MTDWPSQRLFSDMSMDTDLRFMRFSEPIVQTIDHLCNLCPKSNVDDEGAYKVKHVLLHFLFSPFFLGQNAKREERGKHRIFVTRSFRCAISDRRPEWPLQIRTAGKRNVSWADFIFVFIESGI